MSKAHAGRATSLAAIAAIVMFAGFVTLPAVTATDAHVKVGHTNSK